jgi:hypothetical protein
LEITGAAVIFAVMVTVNTLDRAQSTAIEDAANVTTDGLVCAAPSTVMTPDANKASTELEPALNRPIAALVVLKPVMVPLIARIVEDAVVPMVVPVMVTMLALVPVTVVMLAEPPVKVVASKLVIVPLAKLTVVILAEPPEKLVASRLVIIPLEILAFVMLAEEYPSVVPERVVIVPDAGSETTTLAVSCPVTVRFVRVALVPVKVVIVALVDVN